MNMHTLLVHTGIIVAIVTVAILVYEGFDFLPQSWKDWMAGVKIKFIAAVTFFAPDAMTLVASIPDLGLEDFVPTTTMNVILKIVAALTFIARLQSFWDKQPDQP